MINITYILFGCLLLSACQGNTTSTDYSTAISDTQSVKMGSASPPQSTSATNTSRTASVAMLNDMRRMMEDIKHMTMSGDPDQDFAMMMKMHHQLAITMAGRELQAGADADLKAMAEKMKAAQQAEVSELDAFLAGYKRGTKTSFADNMMKIMADEKLVYLPMKSDADQDFAALMIRHHQGAMDMSTEYLKTGKEPKIREMARKMMMMQKDEIKKLNDWAARHASKG